jgi:hypothetical protein
MNGSICSRVYEISSALIEPQINHLMINIAHPFDDCLRA